MNKKIKIKDLTEEKFTELMQEALTDNNNHIEISGVIVSSQKSSLKSVEKTINRLLIKHKDFLLLKRESQLKLGYMG